MHFSHPIKLKTYMCTFLQYLKLSTSALVVTDTCHMLLDIQELYCRYHFLPRCAQHENGQPECSATNTPLDWGRHTWQHPIYNFHLECLTYSINIRLQFLLQVTYYLSLLECLDNQQKLQPAILLQTCIGSHLCIHTGLYIAYAQHALKISKNCL